MKNLKLVMLVVVLVVALTGCSIMTGSKVDTGDYKPGTYVGHTEDGSVTIAVVVDRNGNIAGVHFDGTNGSKATDADGNALKDSEDKGLYTAFNYKSFLKGNYPLANKYGSSLTWDQQARALGANIVANQGVSGLEYGLEAAAEDKGDQRLKADTVTGVTIKVKSYIEVVENILNGPAKQTEELKYDKTEGDFKPGVYVSHEDSENPSYKYVVTVDQNGNIAGVFIDALNNTKSVDSTDDNVVYTATNFKSFLKGNYPLANKYGSSLTWDQQAKALGANIVQFQGTDGLEFGLEAAADDKGDQRLKADTVTGVTVKVLHIVEDVQSMLDSIKK